MKDKILEWYQNKSINPYTKRKIKKDGVTYKKLLKLYNKFILENNLQDEDIQNENIQNEDIQNEDIHNEFKLLPINSIEDIDVISLNKIWEIKDNVKVLVYDDPENLVTYKDEMNHIHCFEKESIQY